MEYTCVYGAITLLVLYVGIDAQNCDFVTSCDWAILEGFQIHKPGNKIPEICGPECPDLLKTYGKCASNHLLLLLLLYFIFI